MGNLDIYDELEETLKIECRTIDRSELCEDLIGPYNFKVLSQNIRSLNRNFNKLLPTLSRLRSEFDVLVLSECWLQEHSNIPQLPGYEVHYTKKIINKCGGVTIYVKDCWSTTVQEPIFQDANCLVISVANSLKIVGMYRSPAVRNLEKFNDSLGSLLDSIHDQSSVVVTGDMNIDLLQEPPCKDNQDYQCIMAEHGFLPAITEATRNNSCLDHAFVKTKDKGIGIVCKSSMTDHDLLIVGLVTQVENKRKKNRVTTNVNLHDVANDLDNINWQRVLNKDNVDDAVSELHNIMSTCISKHTHTRKISRSKLNIKPWITPGLIKCMRHRDNLHLKLRQDPQNEVLKITYNRYRNFCNKLLHNLKADHDNTLLAHNHGDPKKLWKAIKNVCDIPSTKKDSQELLSGTTNPQEAINTCNRHFAAAGDVLASKILHKLETTQEALSEHVSFGSRSQNSLFLAPTDFCEVIGIIQGLKADGAPGSDAITPLLLKYAKAALLKPLTHICNLSMATGSFPDYWKRGVITPVHKSGDKASPENYRPISLLSVLSKVLEKLVNKRLVDFLEKYKLLQDCQFGFRRRKSTEDAVQLLTEKVSSYLDSGQRCVGVFLDLAKAFDTVSISILLKKLERFGIRGNTLSWFASYLSNRRQCVKIGGLKSCEMYTAFGVPQGSVLGPTLFTVYMDDIFRLSSQSLEIICYADDTVAIFHGNDWKSAFNQAEIGMAAVSRWLDTNLLTLNIKKTNFIAFHITEATSPDQTQLLIHNKSCEALGIDGTQLSCSCDLIARVRHTRYLGVMIDQHLSFKTHISFISKKARKLIYVMKILRPAAKAEVKMLVYKSLCQSLLQYCVGVWGGAAVTHMSEVERAQRAVLKVMLGKPRRYPTEKLFEEAAVLTVRQLFVMRAIAKCHHLSASQDPTKRKRPRDQLLPRVNTVFAGRLPKYAQIFTYNSVCRIIDIQEETFAHSKNDIQKWLQSLSFKQTENLVKFSEIKYKDIFL